MQINSSTGTAQGHTATAAQCTPLQLNGKWSSSRCYVSAAFKDSFQVHPGILYREFMPWHKVHIQSLKAKTRNKSHCHPTQKWRVTYRSLPRILVSCFPPCTLKNHIHCVNCDVLTHAFRLQGQPQSTCILLHYYRQIIHNIMPMLSEGCKRKSTTTNEA